MQTVLEELKKIKDCILTDKDKAAVDKINALIKYCEIRIPIIEALKNPVPNDNDEIETPAGTHITINANECYITITKDIEEAPDA